MEERRGGSVFEDSVGVVVHCGSVLKDVCQVLWREPSGCITGKKKG